MITKDELMGIGDHKERFELSMIYMMLHGGGTFIDTLTLDDVKAIRSTVQYVLNGMDYTSQKDGTEYFNIEAGDKAYQGMLDLKKRQAAKHSQQQLMERMNRKADEEAAHGFYFKYMNTLNKADGLTVTQIMTEIVKAEVMSSMMVGWMYKAMLVNEIIAAKVLFRRRLHKASKEELGAYSTFLRFNIFANMRNDAQERIMFRDKQLLEH